MSKEGSWLIIGFASVFLWGICYCHPLWLSDRGNSFLSSFVNQEFLAFLGVVVTITLASAANLHLELNKLQDSTRRKFPKTRASVRVSAYSLIASLLSGIIIVITKPYINSSNFMSSLWNSAAIVVLLFDVLVLADLTRAVLRIPAMSDLSNGEPPAAQ